MTPTRSPVKSTPSCGHRPVWYHLPLKLFRPGNARRARRRKVARRHDAEGRGDGLALVGLERPEVGLAVEDGRPDARVELDVAPQIEAVGDVVDVAQDLGLRAVALGPMPFLLQLVGERIGVLHALDVAAAARIAVPEPGAADAAAGLVGAHLQAELAQAMDGVEAANARAHDDDIELCCVRRWRCHVASLCPSPFAYLGGPSDTLRNCRVGPQAVVGGRALGNHEVGPGAARRAVVGQDRKETVRRRT